MKKILFLLSFMQFCFSLAQSDITVGGTSNYNNALGVYKYHYEVNGKPSYLRIITDASQITTESGCAAGSDEEYYMILWTGSAWQWQRVYYEGVGKSNCEWFLDKCVLKATYEEIATSFQGSNLSINISDTPKPGCLGWTGTSTPTFSESDCTANNLNLDHNILKNNLIYYPNPVQNIFNIKFNKTISTVDLSLVDMSGKILLKKTYDNTKAIELEVLQPKGVYFVKLSNKDMDVKIKVIKE